MRVPHHPGIHFGEFDIDLKSLLVPVVVVIMLLVTLYLAQGGWPEVPGFFFGDANMAP